MKLKNHIANVLMDCAIPDLHLICKNNINNPELHKLLIPTISTIFKESCWEISTRADYVELDVYWDNEPATTWVIFS